MFGVGYQEMFVILVIALVVFGPQRLPELAGQAGRWIREFKKMTSGLTGEFEKTMAEVDDIRESVRREMKSMMDEVDDVAEGVKRELGAPAKAKPAAKAAGGNRPAGAGANKGKAAAVAAKKPVALPVATKADPLSDVSALDDNLLTAPVTRRVAANPSAPSSAGGRPAAAAAATTAAKSVPSPESDDALNRVRQRRASAAYSKRVS